MEETGREAAPNGQLIQGRQKNSRIRKTTGHFESQGRKFHVSWRSRGGTKSIVALSYTGFHRLGAEGENTPQAATTLRKETALVVYIL